MKINELRIQGFKSFDEEQVIPFHDFRTGFYFVTGKNLVEPELGANGAGKSAAFIDALCWVLHGKTPSKLKAGNIVNWTGKKKCVVELGFEKNQIDYVLRRCQSPNKLQLSSRVAASTNFRDVTQEELDDLIGLGFDSFLYSIIVSQFSSKFFDLDPEPKLKIFSDILDLGVWLDLSDKAKKEVVKIDKRIYDLEDKVSNVRGQLQSFEELDYTEQIKEWDKKQKFIIETCEMDIEAIRERLVINQKSQKEVLDLLEVIKKKREEALKECSKWQKLVNIIENQIQDLKQERSARESEIRLKHKEIDKFEDVTDICPYCNTEVSKEHLDGEISKLEKELDFLEQAQLKDETVLSSLVETATKDSANKDKVDDELKQIDKDLQKIEFESEDLLNKRDQYEEDLSEKQEKLEEVVVEKNPYFDLELENKGKMKNLKDDKKDLDQALTILHEDRELKNYWVKGYKEVRLFLVAQALQEFEIQVNNNLQKLGLLDWSVELGVDKETGSGTIRKGFDVLVKAPHSEKAVPFACWSGGEGQRLRLAGTFGLMDLITSRKGIDFNIEIWDEPTQFLSSDGIEALACVLKERALDLNKKIFLIDHRDVASFGYFNSKITFIKDNIGSHIQWESIK